MLNDGANEGFWRFQIRDKYGRWVQMGGAVTFSTDHPNFGRISGTGLFEGGSRPGFAMIRVKNHATLEDGVYEVSSDDLESVKAIIPENAPGLVEAKKLDAADGVSANPLAPVTLESLPEATPSVTGENAYFTEFEGTQLDSEEAKRGVHMYVGQGYKLMNKILRDNPEGSVEEFIATSNSEGYLEEVAAAGFDVEFAATAGSKIADLDYAISTTNLKNDTKLYRGMTANSDRYQELLNMEPGDKFQDFGYVSTSTLENSAINFTSTSAQGREQGRKPVIFRMDAPAGSNALRPFSGMGPESEIILPRGTKVEIVSKSQRDGVLIIDAKVVSTRPAPAVPEAPALPEVAPTAKQNNEELTEEQLEALEWYTDTGFEIVANKLRKGLEVPDYYQAEIDTLIDLVSSKQTIQERVIYRGKATTDPVRAEELNNLEVGDVLFDPGIASYSPDEDTADWFAKLSADNPKVGARAVFVVDLPAGSTAFDIPREINPKEPEVLLPPNTSIEVTGIEERAGIRYISAKIVPNAAPADEADESGVKDLSGFTQLSTQKGSNPGGLYQDPTTGEKFYVKFEDAIRVDNEVLASKLYEKTGINAIKVEKGSMDGKTISYSKWEDNTTEDLLDKLENDPNMTQKLKEGFAVDAWLANWDVVGLVYDNLIFDAEGNDLRVDPGGALLYRAQGARKGDAFGDVVGELETFQEGGKTTSRIYGNMTQLDRVMSARKLLDISDADIDEMVDATISDAADNELLKTRLKNRRSYILTTYGLDGKAPAKPSEETISGWTETSPGVQGLEESVVFDQILTEDTLRYDLLTSPLPEVDAGVFSDAQRDAIDGYTGPEYFHVNGLLRTGKVDDRFKDHIESRISDLDSAMDEVGVLEAPARVFRGIKGWKPGTTFYSGVDWAQEMENLKVGDVFSDDGYMSTTEDPRIAYEEFGGGERTAPSDGTSGIANNAIEQTNATVFFSIDIPAGSKALKLPKEFVYQNQQDEQEVLLPRGTKLKVKAIRRVRQDRDDIEAYNYFVDAEAVPQAEVDAVDAAEEASSSGGWTSADGLEAKGESGVLDSNLTGEFISYDGLEQPVSAMDADMFTRDQRVAIKGYTGTDYSYINKLLRTGEATDTLRVHLEKEVVDLDSAMEENGILESPARVFRGLIGHAPGTSGFNGTDWAEVMSNLEVGDIFTDEGYMSASNDPLVAHDLFGPGSGATGAVSTKYSPSNEQILSSNASVFFSIDLPAGTKALGIPDEFSTSNREKEVLLARGTQLRVKAIRRVRQDRTDKEAYNYYVDAEAIPQDEVGVIDVVSEAAEDRGAVVRPEPVSMVDANGYEIPPGEQILHNFSTLSGEDFEASFTYTGYNGRMFGASEKEAAENLIIVESEGNPYIDDGFYFIESRFANMVLDLDENGEVSDEQSKMWDEDLANLDPQAFVEFRKMADPKTLTFIESASEAAAIKTYTLPESFTAVAKLLRSEKSLETLEDEADIKNADVIKTLDSIIERSPDLEVGSTLYRGVKRSDRSIMKALRDSIIDGSITEISDTSFGSTSESQYVASNFAGMPRSDTGENLTTVFRIKVTTPGRKGLRIPPFMSIISEQEVILPRGSTYKVVGHEVNKGGTLFVDLEY